MSGKSQNHSAQNKEQSSQKENPKQTPQLIFPESLRDIQVNLSHFGSFDANPSLESKGSSETNH